MKVDSKRKARGDAKKDFRFPLLLVVIFATVTTVASCSPESSADAQELPVAMSLNREEAAVAVKSEAPVGEVEVVQEHGEIVTEDEPDISLPPESDLLPGDLNFDPDWDWTVDEPYDLFVSTASSGIVHYPNIRLPYYAGSESAADDSDGDLPGAWDIRPEDGWVLLFRDFGTAERGVVWPKIILYNKYRGLLRLFYYNIHIPEAYPYGMVGLRREDASDPFALFTYLDDANTTLDDFDPDRTEIFTGQLQPLAWNYADFVVAGYDPELPDDATFVFDIEGVKEGDASRSSGLSHLPGFVLRVPGAIHLGNDNLPFYDEPLGIFNLRSRPTIDFHTVWEVRPCRGPAGIGGSGMLEILYPKRFEHVLDTPEVLINPHAGIKASLEAAYIPRRVLPVFSQEGRPDGYFDLFSVPDVTDVNNDPVRCGDEAPTVTERKVAIRVTVMPEAPVPDFTPVTLIKVYPSEYHDAGLDPLPFQNFEPFPFRFELFSVTPSKRSLTVISMAIGLTT